MNNECNYKQMMRTKRKKIHRRDLTLRFLKKANYYCNKFLLLFFLTSKNVPLNIWVNTHILKILYLPIGFCAVLIFTVSSLILMPIAYLKSLIHKALIFKRKLNMNSLSELIFFWAFGLFILCFGLYGDLLIFTRHLFHWQHK